MRNAEAGIRESKTAGLYIHIPFCLVKCGYCDFYSDTSISSMPIFLEALLEEMEMVREDFGPFDAVYIGGGTPSLLRIEDLEGILAKVREKFILLPDPEITLEANPADLNVSYLKSLRKSGVNRLNIGIQSFNEAILAFLGRRHSSKEAVLAIENSRRAGFENLGLDLIYGIPGQGLDLWKETLCQALTFLPEHLSCYQLTLGPRTPLGLRYQRGDFSLPGEAAQYDFFMKTAEWLEEEGYFHYEVSNFARDATFASRHNQKYWNHSPYLGLGPAAHSFFENRRWWNHPSLERYIKDLGAKRPPVEEMEILTLEELRLEALFLGLRTKKGIDLQEFADLMIEKREILSRLLEEKLLLIDKGLLVPTRSGLAVADRLALI